MVLFASLICVAMAQGQAVPFSGTVAGPDGTPVAGAELILAGLPVYDPPILRGAFGRVGPVPTRSSGRAGGPGPLHRPYPLGREARLPPVLHASSPARCPGRMSRSGSCCDRPVRPRCGSMAPVVSPWPVRG